MYECSTQISEKDFENLSVIEMQDKLSQILENSYNEKMLRLEIKELRNIERILYLQVLDNAWREHLYQMDILKTGIGLRGYNQKILLWNIRKKVIIFSWSWSIVLNLIVLNYFLACNLIKKRRKI